MTETVRGGPVPFLLRGFLRLLVLGTPLFLLFVALDADHRRVTWLDTRTSFGRVDLPAGWSTPRTGAELQGEGQVRYVVDHASLGLWVVSLAPAFLLVVAASAVALLLLRTLRDTYAGRPFSAFGVRRLRRIAAVVAVSAVVVPALQSVSAHAIVTRVVPDQAPGLLGQWDLLGATLPWLLVALLVLCIAEAFGIGTRLADDVDGLV